MKTSQSFQFYPTDFLLGTALMSPSEVGIYIRLLCFQWQEGSLPNDENLLARLASCAPQEISGVIGKFRLHSDGKLRNAKLESVRKSLNAWRLSRVENGKKGGRPRKLVVSGSLDVAKAKKSSPSPSPSPIPLINHDEIVIEKNQQNITIKTSDAEKREAEAMAANLTAIPLDVMAEQSVVELWRDWCDHRTEMSRRDKRKPWTPRAASSEMASIARAIEQHGSESVAMQMRAALAGSWQGLNLNTIRPAYKPGGNMRDEQRRLAREEPSGI